MTLGKYSYTLPAFLVPFSTFARISTTNIKMQKSTFTISASFYSTTASTLSSSSTAPRVPVDVLAPQMKPLSITDQDPSKGHLVKIGKWSSLEDNTLCKNVKRHGMNWLQVACNVNQRAPEQCAARWDIINEAEVSNELPTEYTSVSNNTGVKECLSTPSCNTTSISTTSTFNVRRRRAINYWSKEEEAQLRAAVEEHGMEWSKVAKMLPGRSQNSCRSRWYFTTANASKRGHWSSKEDALLSEAVKMYPYGEWARVARRVPGRTDRQCRRRWVEHLANQNQNQTNINTSTNTATIRCGRKTTWTEQENERLKRLVAEYGFLWTTIARHMGSRNATQCRDRWRSSMIPGIKSGHWTEEEDELLRKGVEQYNRRWKMVASMVPGRTARQCSARWNAAIDPTYNYSKWSSEEDERLMSAVLSVPGDSSQLGFDWESCSKYLNYKRSARQCRHRYRCLERLGRVNIGQEKESFSNRLYRSFLSEQYNRNIQGHQLNDSADDDEEDWDLLATDTDIDLNSFNIDESLFLDIANE
jgi:hypothetical protein